MVDLPEPERPVNQSTRGLLVLQPARARRGRRRAPANGCWGAPEREADHAGGDGRVGEAVDQDEAAGVAVLLIGVEGDRRGGRDVDEADLVQLQHLRRRCARACRRRAVFQLGHRAPARCASCSSGDTGGRAAAAPRPSREIGGELVGDAAAARRARQNVAAADVDLVVERQHDRLAGDRWLDAPREPTRMRAMRLARPDAATTISSPTRRGRRRSCPAKPRKSWFGRLTHCTGRRNGAATDAAARRRRVSRCSSSAGRNTKACARLGVDDVVAGARRDRDRRDVGEVDSSAANAREVGFDALETAPRRKPTRSILFTASTTWRMPSSETMMACRRVCVSSALGGVDEQDGEVGGRGAGRHVAGVLLVARACRRR